MSAEHIADCLEADIVAGHYPPGTELKQGALADRFQISRIPVRDALQLLASRGLIDLIPNRRAQVISLTPAEIREVYDLRILLECDCLKHAIGTMTVEDMSAISIAFEHSSIDAQTPKWSDGDWAFHQALYTPAGKPRQIRMIKDLRRHCRIHIAGYGDLPDRTSEWLKDHQMIVEACKARDPEKAAGTLERHIDAAAEMLLDAISSFGKSNM